MKKDENRILWRIYEKMKYLEATLSIDHRHYVTPGMRLCHLGYKIYDPDSPKSLLPVYLIWVAFGKQLIGSKKMKKMKKDEKDENNVIFLSPLRCS